jgi:hypothetical protein
MTKPLQHALALTGVLCAVHAPAADAPSVEDRLKQLETTVQSLQKENADLRKELGWEAGKALVVAKPAGKEKKLTIGGYLQLQGEFGDAPDARYNGINDRFLARRARLTAAGSFLEDLDFKLEADFGNNAIGGKTGYSGQITDVFINWNTYSFANVKMGQFKTPFGYEQLISDTKILTIERSLPNDRLTASRQLGLGVAGDFLNKRVGYSAGLFNGNNVNNGFNDNDQFLYAGRIFGTPVETRIANQDFKWTVGLNGYASHDANVSITGFGFDSTPASAALDNIFAGKRAAWAADTQLKFGPAELQAEFYRARFKPDSNLPASSFDSEGWQIAAAYFVIPKYLQAVVKYESFNPNTAVSGDSTDIWTFGVNYCIKGDDLKLSLNYLLGNPAGGADDHQGRLMARAQLIF